MGNYEKNSFASSPWGFRTTELKQQCQWLKDHEIKYICGQFRENTPGAFAPGITPEQIAQARELVESFGLSYASFNADGDFMVQDGLEQQIELCCHQIDLAWNFKPQVIIVFAGWQDRDDDAVYSQVSESLKKIARHAAQYSLTVALENHGGLTRTAEQCNRIIQAVGEPNIGLNYDPANFEMHGEDPIEAIKKIQVPVVFSHFKSVRLDEAGKKVYCRLKDGYLDYRAIVRAVIDKEYHGIWAIEYEETSDVFAGSHDDLEMLRELLEAD